LIEGDFILEGETKIDEEKLIVYEEYEDNPNKHFAVYQAKIEGEDK